VAIQRCSCDEWALLQASSFTVFMQRCQPREHSRPGLTAAQPEGKLYEKHIRFLPEDADDTDCMPIRPCGSRAPLCAAPLRRERLRSRGRGACSPCGLDFLSFAFGDDVLRLRWCEG
jgi:hypothetical protein